ncbi:hypothetical protein S40285_05942 [Stachybotrys chlorohalonatus IBT 40285]|uniref:BZIP domain-containing protein n=1 Tax=Stachybotrys chlorohalonatus (strain IBT 40285) TaxID=1283841 RepID=A0A084QVD3_STAC4|nr:hypothetical protein S40285_05942 [Stachybotrys chlorohalonata IBT 40285]
MPSMLLHQEDDLRSGAHHATPTESHSEPQTGSMSRVSRKRQRPTDSILPEDGEQAKKRARGRPRLNTTDETATDRRRTQIRLAQRAYRHRKDTAITTLEERVKALERINEAMIKEFADFHAYATAKGLQIAAPSIARRLDGLSSALSQLREERSNSVDTDGCMPSPTMETRTVHGHSVDAVTPTTSHQSSSSPLGYRSVLDSSVSAQFVEGNAASSTFQMPPNYNPPYMYEVIAQPTQDNASFPFPMPLVQPVHEHAKDPDVVAPMLFSGLPPPLSYAFDESSFSRRLHRSALEAGLRLATMPNPPIDTYCAVFGFCLLYEAPENIVRRLMTALSRTREEGLNYWRAPFTNLGGSGMLRKDFGDETHFEQAPAQRRWRLDTDMQSVKEIQRPQDMTGFSMGPFDARTESVRDKHLDREHNMLLPGFEGKFYDPKDAELYLNSRGVFIPPHADFVDVEINIEDFTDPPEPGIDYDTYGIPGPGEPRKKTRMNNQAHRYNGPDSGSGRGVDHEHADGPSLPSNGHAVSPTAQTFPDSAALVTADTSDDGGPIMFYCPLFPGQSWPKKGPKLVKVTIDVEVLINEMIGKMVCLGRAPALRPKDINRALKIAAGLPLRSSHNHCLERFTLPAIGDLIMEIQETSPSLPKFKPKLIIHGGAGNILRQNFPPDKYEAYRTALISIVSVTRDYMNSPAPFSGTAKSRTLSLARRPSSLDVATFAVRQLEDHPLFNSGHGAVFTRDGINELEASVMVSRGYKKRGVGVMGLRRVRNPIVLARKMLEHGEDDLAAAAMRCPNPDVPSAQGHTQLYGTTAEALARQYGLDMVEPSYFFTQQRWDEHVRGLENEKARRGLSTWDADEYFPQGTCGAVALDEDGVVCVATSTGGLTNKLTGRIGDTPVVGAGFWAEEWTEEGDPVGTSSLLGSLGQAPMILSGMLKGMLADCLPTPYVYSPIPAEHSPRRICTTTRSLAVSGTGNGDSFLRTSAGRSVGAIARFQPQPGSRALSHIAGPGGELQRSAGDRWRKTGEGEGGMIGIECAVVRDAGGKIVGTRSEILQDFNCGGMFRAWIDDDGQAVMSIWSNGAPDEER